jgi:hypothetical protein
MALMEFQGLGIVGLQTRAIRFKASTPKLLSNFATIRIITRHLHKQNENLFILADFLTTYMEHPLPKLWLFCVIWNP